MQSIEGLAQLAAGAFVSSLWQGALLAAAVAVGLRLMPKMSAAVRFAVWSAVFMVVLLLPFIQMWMGHAHSGIAPVAGIHLDVRWSYAIVAVWFGLTLTRGVKLTISGLRLRALWKRSMPAARDLSSALSPAVAGSREIEICTSTEVDRPSVIGFFRPRILIPAWLFEKLTPAELEQIVMHEAGHISRADDWLNLFQKIGLVLFPLNPALMWIDRRLCFERELACDDGVLECTHAPGAYASCLVNLAERSKDRRAISLTLGAWERQSELTRRVHSILRGGDRMRPWQMRLASGGMVVALLGAGIGLSQCPHLVSFTPVQSMDLASSNSATGAMMMPVRSSRGPAASFQPAVFHPSASARETLVKTSLPSRRVSKPARAAVRKSPAVVPTVSQQPILATPPAMQNVKQASAGTQNWLVLTSYDVPADPSVRPGVVFAVTDKHAYAALPTGDGWLVIQL
jgi:beta-lactamase regulating signal transducer with metallopeptidase domain